MYVKQNTESSPSRWENGGIYASEKIIYKSSKGNKYKKIAGKECQTKAGKAVGTVGFFGC
jgi:hypothetical protein